MFVNCRSKNKRIRLTIYRQNLLRKFVNLLYHLQTVLDMIVVTQFDEKNENGKH